MTGMTKPDLHMHSSCSDGVLSPEMLAREAQEAGVTVMALTDHDTFAGSDHLLKEGAPLRVIPGVELSLNDMHGLHLLAYGTAEGTPLRKKVAGLAAQRVTRAWRMLDKLAELGMPLSREELAQKCRGTVGRPHIARAMVHAGYVGSMQEAFARYIGHDGPAYVPGERLSMAEALPLVLQSGFVPVLAHPRELNQPDEALTALLEKWQAAGLLGMEVYHPSALAKGYDSLLRMARRMGLLVTGGSDFHQENDKHGQIGCTAAAWISAEEDVAALEDAMRRQGRTAEATR